jgi:hypothetical protein
VIASHTNRPENEEMKKQKREITNRLWIEKEQKISRDFKELSISNLNMANSSEPIVLTSSTAST